MPAWAHWRESTGSDQRLRHAMRDVALDLVGAVSGGVLLRDTDLERFYLPQEFYRLFLRMDCAAEVVSSTSAAFCCVASSICGWPCSPDRSRGPVPARPR